MLLHTEAVTNQDSGSIQAYKPYRKNPITIRTLLQYAPQTLTGNLCEKVSLAVQHAPDLCHGILYFFFKPCSV